MKDPFFGPMFVMKLRSAEPSFPDQSLTESLIVYIAPSTWDIHTVKYQGEQPVPGRKKNKDMLKSSDQDIRLNN